MEDGERMRMGREDEREKNERERKGEGKRKETLPQDVRAAKYETGLRDKDDDLDPLLVTLSSFIPSFYQL